MGQWEKKKTRKILVCSMWPRFENVFNQLQTDRSFLYSLTFSDLYMYTRSKYMLERYISGLIDTSLGSRLEDHTFCRPPHLLQLVTSTGFSEQSAEILFKSTWSKHMINAFFPSQLGLIIQRFTKPLIPLKIQPGKAAFYDTGYSYLCTTFSLAWKGCYKAKWFIKNTASHI